jgi:hypothetical protein
MMLLRQNIEDNEKECKLTYIDILSAALEDTPMGILNFSYIMRRVRPPPIGAVALACG